MQSSADNLWRLVETLVPVTTFALGAASKAYADHLQTRTRDRREIADRRLRLHEHWLVQMADGQAKNTARLIEDLEDVADVVRRCCTFKVDAYARRPDGPVVPYPSQLGRDLSEALAAASLHGNRVSDERLRERVATFCKAARIIETIASGAQAEDVADRLEVDWLALKEVLAAHLCEIESKLHSAIE